MNAPIGDYLVRMGMISEKQRVLILEEQRLSGRPFGQIAEELFGVKARDVEKAWAAQYAGMSEPVNPTLERIDPLVIGLITRRQAWQFRLLPLRYEAGSLLVCTTQEHLPRAANFATRNIPATCFFVLALPEALGEALMRHYPMDGMTPDMVPGGAGGEGLRQSA